MHSRGKSLPQDELEDACDTVLNAFVDAFVLTQHGIPPAAWLARLIQQLEDARLELLEETARQQKTGQYAATLARARRRVEVVLGQLYEEQLLY